MTNMRATATDRLQIVRRALERVVDPEIPTINVVEMGMIADVRIEGAGVVVEATTLHVTAFSACRLREIIVVSSRSVVIVGPPRGRAHPFFRREDLPPHSTYGPSHSTYRFSLSIMSATPAGTRCR